MEFSSTNHDELGNVLHRDIFGELNARVQEKSQWIITVDDTVFDLPFTALVARRREGNSMYLVEEHSTQRIPSVLRLPFRSELSSTTEFLSIREGNDHAANPGWISGNRVKHPQLGDSPRRPARLPARGTEQEASVKERRSPETPASPQRFYRDLRNRCDRGADERVIGASLQHAQLEMLHSNTWRSNPSYWRAFTWLERSNERHASDDSLQPR